MKDQLNIRLMRKIGESVILRINMVKKKGKKRRQLIKKMPFNFTLISPNIYEKAPKMRMMKAKKKIFHNKNQYGKNKKGKKRKSLINHSLLYHIFRILVNEIRNVNIGRLELRSSMEIFRLKSC